MFYKCQLQCFAMFKAVKLANKPSFTSEVKEVLIGVLPMEILQMIFAFLSKYEQFVPALVCKDWYHALVDMRRRRGETVWKTSLKRMFATPSLANWTLSSFAEQPSQSSEIYTQFLAPENRWKAIAMGGNMQMCCEVLGIAQFANYNKRLCFVITLVKNGHFHVVQWLHANKQSLLWDFLPQKVINCVGEYATASRNIPFLEWLLSIGCVFTETAYREAIINSHHHVIKWLSDHNCPRDTSQVYTAVCHDMIDMSKHLLHHGFTIDEDCVLEGIARENFEMVKTLLAFNAELPLSDRIAMPTVCASAAQVGSMEILQYLLEMGYPMSEDTFAAAAENGSMDTLQFLRDRGCPFDATVQTAAVENGHLHVIQWLTEELQCPFDEITFEAAGRLGDLDIVRYLHDHNCPSDKTATAAAAGNGHLEVLQFMIDHEYVEENLTIPATENGHVRILDYAWGLDENEDEWGDDLFETAASCGQAGVIEWLHRHGFFVTPETMTSAIDSGEFNLLPLIHSLGGTFTPSDVAKIVAFAPRNILDWFFATFPAHQPIVQHRNTAITAARGGNLDMLKFIHDRGLILGVRLADRVFAIAEEHEHYDIVEWGATVGYATHADKNRFVVLPP